MGGGHRTGKLAVILHADVAGSTALVRQNEQLAHERIQAAFQRFGTTISNYRGNVRELRGDALLAEFERASDAVTAALAFQADQVQQNARLGGDIKAMVRIGIAVGEVIIADDTITGAGVVLAQRIEQLTEPGGVGIQGAAHETIPDRFPFNFENSGEHQVKGFDNPVVFYTIRLKPGAEIPRPGPRSVVSRKKALVVTAFVLILASVTALWFLPWRSPQQPDSSNSAANPVSDKPSIIVLPFDNLSDDSSQAYFAHGITEDVTTDLSRLSGLFVIARNTAFTYLGKAVDPKELSADLGVKYVLEGSVRRVGDILRINVQLIDGQTGGHLWANRYDGAPDDVLTFQDSVVKNVVSSLALKLEPDQEMQLARQETTNPKAYDAFLQGWALYIRRTPADYAEAVKHFKRAIELDPDYGQAYAALASTYWEGWERWWYKQLGFDEWIGPRREAEKYLEIALRKPTALAHQVASELRRQQGRLEDMVREAETAVRLDPNDPNSYIALAWADIIYGKPDEALAAVNRAMTLDPHYPAFYLYLKGNAYFHLREYGRAAEFLERALARNPANFSAANILIPTYAHMGRLDAAREQLEKFPVPLSIDWIKYYYRYRRPEDWTHLSEGLRKAGVPEVATKVPRPPED